MTLYCRLCGTVRLKSTPQPDRRDAARYRCPTCGVYELTGPAKAAWQSLSNTEKSRRLEDLQTLIAEANASGKPYTIVCRDLERSPLELRSEA